MVVKKFFDEKKELNYHLSRQPGDYVQIVIVNADQSDNHDYIYEAYDHLEKLLKSNERKVFYDCILLNALFAFQTALAGYNKVSFI